MKEEQLAERNKLIRKMKGLFNKIVTENYMGKYDKALKYIEQEENLIKRFQGELPEEIKGLHTRWLRFRTIIYAFRGDLARSFNDANELLTVAQLYDQKWGISEGRYALGRYFMLSGDLDEALVHIDRAIKLSEDNLNDLWDFMFLANQFYVATKISIDRDDLERAKNYFKHLEEIRDLKPGEISINDKYQLAKALLLKSSMRSRDRVMAEDIFKEFIEETRSDFPYRLRALSELCELLLVELKISNDLTIISEIKLTLEKLIGMSQHSGLHFFLIEAYILHGKLALVTFDLDSFQRYLTEAQRMAERYGYIGLAEEIASLHEAMMEKKDTWKKMEKNEASISKRMDLARLDDHLKGKFRMRMMKMERAYDTPPKKEVF